MDESALHVLLLDTMSEAPVSNLYHTCTPKRASLCSLLALCDVSMPLV